MSKIEEVMKDFNKKHKEELVHFGVSSYDYVRIPFTSPRLNYMSFGGLPVGKLHEFYGEEHGGKTTTALDVVANAQRMFPNKKVLYIDVENSLDTVWATKIGVDVDDMIICNPTIQGAEDLFDFAEDMIKTGEVSLIVIDSLGALESDLSREKDIGDKTYGGISLALTKFSKRAVGLGMKHNCTIIGINQERDDLNSPYGGTTTPGGKAWKFHCMTRFNFRKGYFFDSKGNKLSRNAENPAGNQVLVSMTKNKSCAPTRRIGFYTLRYDIGIDYITDLIEVAEKFGIVVKSGSWMKIVNITTGEVLVDKIHGQDALRQLLEEDDETFVYVEQAVNTELNGNNDEILEEELEDSEEE